MDALRYRDDLRASAGRMRWWREVDRWRGRGKAEKEEEEELVEVLLQGRAPWGFTLRGGTEHREPLIITKVEQGSVAAAARLQAGDEMVSVNAVPLNGSRLEAISLVKSSHQTLALVIRRRNRFKGKNEALSRPHSWHSSKLTEEVAEPARSEANPAPIWQPKHEARSKETFTPADQSPVRQDSSPPSSVNSMERVECPAHLFPPGHLSPPKYGSTEPLGSARRDSPFNCFSSGSSPPINDPSSAGRRGTSTESIFFKGFQGDGAEPGDRLRVLHSAGWNGSRGEEQPACRVSFAGRPGGGPVWQAPKKKASQPLPPPAPPLRSDSFAATKVFPYSDGPSGAPQSGRSLGKPPESSQRRPSKLFSLSSSDVRQSHYALPPAHQRQHSDESPFYLQARAVPPTRIQSVGSYYRSLQDLPANAFCSRQGRQSAAATNPSQESGGVSRSYGTAAKQAAELKARQGCSSAPWMNSSNSVLPASLKTKAKFSAPTTAYGEKKDHSGGLTYEFSARDTNDPLKRGKGPSSDVKRLFQSNTQKAASSQHQDPWLPHEDQRISSLKTPLLHSLTQESWSLTAAAPAAVPAQDAGSGKLNRRSDRYATTLRKEIQQKRAQLQKSRSAATLTCEPDEDEPEEWRSVELSASSGASSYKDHLKEAQARVLQATSFQRRDLEPLGADVLKVSNGRFRGRKRFHPAKRTHSFSEPDKMDKVGVEGGPQMGSENEGKVFQAKPAFARPSPKPAPTDSNQTHQTQEKGRPSNDDIHLRPGRSPPSLEQQRLGTFAEYQATWNKQKKTAEAKTPGKFHSAENILDAEADEMPACVHERSRSSPSADFYPQKITSPWRDPEDQKSTSTSREKLESRQSVPAVSRNPGPDHRTKADPASASQTAPSPGTRSISPSSPSSSSSLLLPPALPLGPETTSSSQEFPTGSRSDPTALQTLPRSGSDSHVDAQPSPSAPAPAPARFPHRCAAAGPDAEGESEQQPSLSPPSSPPPPAALPLPESNPARSPSPQFTPARLTDKPPAVQDESQLRWDKAAMEANSLVRKVPVRIIRSENGAGGSVGSLSHAPLSDAAENSDASLFSAVARQAAGDPEQPSNQEGRPAGPVEEEDAKREELAKDIMGKDKSLVDILDQSGRKTTMDLMEGLFPPEEKILEGAQQRRRASAGSRLPTSASRSSDRWEHERGRRAVFISRGLPCAQLLLLQHIRSKGRAPHQDEGHAGAVGGAGLRGRAGHRPGRQEARADPEPGQEVGGAAGGAAEPAGGRGGQRGAGPGGGGHRAAPLPAQPAGQVPHVCGRPGQGGEPAAVAVRPTRPGGERPQQPGGRSAARGEANADGETQAPHEAARGRQGAEGEPGPQGAAGDRRHGGPLERRASGRLQALRQDEVGAHHRAAQARGQDQAGRGAAQVPAGESAAGAEAAVLTPTAAAAAVLPKRIFAIGTEDSLPL